MAVSAITNLSTSGSTATGTVFTTASVVIPANRVSLVAVAGDNGGTPAPTATLTGAGLTWTAIANSVDTGGTRRITLFRAVSPTEASGALTITWSSSVGGDVNWSIAKLDNVKITGTNASDAIVQSATNGTGSATTVTVTLGAFADAGNATLGALFLNGARTTTVGSGFTKAIEDNTSTGRTLCIEFRTDNDTTVDWSWSAAPTACAVAVELSFALNVEPGGGFFNLM